MRLLIIKLSSLGDVVHAVPVVHALRKASPDIHISWLVSKPFSPLVSMIPGVDHIYTFDREAFRNVSQLGTNIKKLLALVKELRSEHFDAVLDLQGLLRSGLFAYFSKAPVRIGLDHAREGAHFFYTHTVEVKDKNLHAVDQNLSVLPCLIPKRK